MNSRKPTTVEILAPEDDRPTSIAGMVQSQMAFSGALSMEAVAVGNYRRGIAFQLQSLKKASDVLDKELKAICKTIVDRLTIEGEKRAATFEKAQITAFKAYDVAPADITFKIAAEVLTPGDGNYDDDDDDIRDYTSAARRKRRRQQEESADGPIPYTQYKASITVSTETRAIQSWTGGFTVSKKFKLAAPIVRMLQSRDELRAQREAIQVEMKRIKVEEADQICIIKDVTKGVMSEQFIQEMDGGEQMYEAVMARLTTDPRVSESNDPLVLQALKDMSPSGQLRLGSNLIEE